MNKSTQSGRPVLTLPGFRAASIERARANQPAKSRAVEKLSAAGSSGELRPEYHSRMLDELAGILGIERDLVPRVFSVTKPLPLKIGVRGDILVRFPNARRGRLSRWLTEWCSTPPYRFAVAHGLNRHDLDGTPCAAIEDRHRRSARAKIHPQPAKPTGQSASF